MMESSILVYITAVGSVEETGRIADALLAVRVVACVNRVEGVHSA